MSMDALRCGRQMVSGGLFVMTTLMTTMQKLSAKCLVMTLELQKFNHSLALALKAYGWITWSVLAMKAVSLNVTMVDGIFTIVIILKTQELNAAPGIQVNTNFQIHPRISI